MVFYVPELKEANFASNYFSAGLLTQERCAKAFPTEPKHFLHLRRLMEWMCVSLACMSRNMDLNVPFLTPGIMQILICLKKQNNAELS